MNEILTYQKKFKPFHKRVFERIFFFRLVIIAVFLSLGYFVDVIFFPISFFLLFFVVIFQIKTNKFFIEKFLVEQKEGKPSIIITAWRYNSKILSDQEFPIIDIKTVLNRVWYMKYGHYELKIYNEHLIIRQFNSYAWTVDDLKSIDEAISIEYNGG